MAVSGTVILLAFRLQKSLLPSGQFPIDLHHRIAQSSPQALRSCISSGKETARKSFHALSLCNFSCINVLF